MCGIVGLYLKDHSLEPELGRHLSGMLAEMSDRGPDSAGFAIYGGDTEVGCLKLSLHHPSPTFDWQSLIQSAPWEGGVRSVAHRDNHTILKVATTATGAKEWLRAQWPDVHIVSIGDTIEIYKDKGLPETVAAKFKLEEMSGSHALGHTRMATESAITTEHSHPFSTGEDLCLVHNGSLSNHNSLRRELRRAGVEFQTDNDTEVAAGYFAHQLASGATLKEALEKGFRDLDGFYTFAIGTRDGFAVVRDGIACKPAVLAETDAWVAMASEYRAIAHLPGADKAVLWEPEPEKIYTWGSA